MKDADELSKLTITELEKYAEQHKNISAALGECLEAINLIRGRTIRSGSRRDEMPNWTSLANRLRVLEALAEHRERVEKDHNSEAQKKRLELLKQNSAYELEDAHFTYEDGSKDSTSYEICLAQRATELIVLEPEAGKIYFENGLKLLCVHPYASYGGGAATLWAIEGVSAQLTLHSIRSGYIRGKCLEIHENPLGITFQAWAWPNADGVMQQNDSAPRFLEFDDIKRYDTNWW